MLFFNEIASFFYFLISVHQNIGMLHVADICGVGPPVLPEASAVILNFFVTYGV